MSLCPAAARVPARAGATAGSSASRGFLAQLAGEGARLVASPRRRVFPGRPDQVGQARRFVARALDGCPAADDAVLCAYELASNALQHTRSGQDGRFPVLVWRGRTSACVAVIDDGAPIGPAPRSPGPGDLAESGHGLRVVADLAAAWGHQELSPAGLPGRAVWFQLIWPAG
ncbi:MAG: ATP-binding protein [Streptosporangiaceae bacterium]